MAKLQYAATGRRKSSVARVRLIPGNGNITVNKKSLDDYFGGKEIVKREVRRPFMIAGCEGKFDVVATVNGGGFTGQAGALRHGISRACLLYTSCIFSLADMQKNIIYDIVIQEDLGGVYENCGCGRPRRIRS